MKENKKHTQATESTKMSINNSLNTPLPPMGKNAWFKLLYTGEKHVLNDSQVDCSTRELETFYVKSVYIWLAPVVIIGGVIGNALSAAIYGHKFLRNSPTVRLLTYKAMASLLYLLCMVHMDLYHTVYGYKSKNTFKIDGDPIAKFYWTNLPWTLFISNTLGTIAVWLSVCVTAEHFLLVTLPVLCKDVLTMGRANVLTILLTVLAALLHLYHVVCMQVVKVQCGYDGSAVKYFYIPISLTIPQAIHYAYYYAETGISVVVPLLLMIVFSAGLYWKLVMHSRFRQSMNEQKRCILWLAASTAVCHLLLETPHALVLLVAALGVGNDRRAWAESAHGVMLGTAMALGLLHMALPFVVYLILSRKFRSIFLSMCIIQPSTDDYNLYNTSMNGVRDKEHLITTKQHDQIHNDASQEADNLHARRDRAQSEPLAKVNDIFKTKMAKAKRDSDVCMDSVFRGGRNDIQLGMIEEHDVIL